MRSAASCGKQTSPVELCLLAARSRWLEQKMAARTSSTVRALCERSRGRKSSPPEPETSIRRSDSSLPEGSVSERSKRFTKRKQNTKLSLTSHHSADVGTIKELDEAVRGARQSLQSFAATPTPEPTLLRAVYFGNCVYTFRFLLQRVSVLKPAP